MTLTFGFVRKRVTVESEHFFDTFPTMIDVAEAMKLVATSFGDHSLELAHRLFRHDKQPITCENLR